MTKKWTIELQIKTCYFIINKIFAKRKENDEWLEQKEAEKAMERWTRLKR